MNHNEILARMRVSFQAEAVDLLNELDSSLLQLEADPSNEELIHRVFRAIHTLKGSGAMAGFGRLPRFAHRVEEVFDAARDGKVQITPGLVDLALQSCDLLRELLEDADRTPDRQSTTECRLVSGLGEFVEPKVSPLQVTALPSKSGLHQLYRIRFIPGLRMLFSGNDPIALVNELSALGSAHVAAHISKLPPFENLDAEQCYVWWKIDLISDASEQAIRDVFVFVDDDCELEIQQCKDEHPSGAAVRVSSFYFESFYSEAEEHLQIIEDFLVRVERVGESHLDLAELFRRLHSLKGACALILGESGNLAPQHPLQILHQVVHAAESLVEQQRERLLSDSGNTASMLLEVCATMRRLLQSVDENRAADVDPTLLERLGIAVSHAGNSSQDAKHVAFLEAAGQCIENMRACLLTLQSSEREPSAVAAYERALHTLEGACQYAGINHLGTQLRDHKSAFNAWVRAAGTDIQSLVQQLQRTGQIVDSIGRGASANGSLAVDPVRRPTPELRSRSSDTGSQTIRVDQEKLDCLIRNVSQLLVARGALQLLARKLDRELVGRELSAEAKETSTSISRISEELQGTVMSLRMLPVKTVFQRFPRLIRDLGRSLEKDIEVTLHGGEIELDKAVIQEIGDPLVHLVRNAADHGIESPEQREASGKSRCGHIALRAYHEGGQIVIEVEDDGKGLHAEVLKLKAVQRGLLTEAEADCMSAENAYQLIFSPGFSTAEAVTDVSGRGVGMDVVSSNVQKLKGTIAIESCRGAGTKFVIKLPTSLMISKGILTECGDSEFILPLESVSITRKIPATDIHHYRHHAMVHTNEGPCPVISLREQLCLGEESDDDEKSLVVINTSGRKYGLLVDRLIGEEQVVVKPLSGGLEKYTDFLGATIMGDGRVVLVLDPGAMAV